MFGALRFWFCFGVFVFCGCGVRNDVLCFVLVICLGVLFGCIVCFDCYDFVYLVISRLFANAGSFALFHGFCISGF